MKPRKNAFLISSLALAAACTVQAAPIDVIGTLAPVNTTDNSGVKGVNALTVSQTWTKNNEYFLTDRVFVPKNITLTIEPGTKIYGSINDNGTPTNKADDKVGSLVAARGGRIIADGTAAEPIIFTAVAVWEAENNMDSPFDPDGDIGVLGNPNNGMPDEGDAGLWGGVVVLGNAYIAHAIASSGVNNGVAQIEGFVPGGTPDQNSNGFPDASEYGFDASGDFIRDDNDDSGVYRYISISHGGYEFAEGREINGLTLGGVGASTVIDHVEIFANQDDGIEFFGGTANSSHIFLAFNQDDNFDFDSGYTGTMQFFFSVANPGFADGGFEHDGVETTTGANHDNAITNPTDAGGLFVPKTGITLSKPRFFNGTVIGPGRTNTFTTIASGSGQVLIEKGNHGLIYEHYYNGELYNSVIDDFSQQLAAFRAGAKAYGATATAAHNTVGRFGESIPSQIDTATVTIPKTVLVVGPPEVSVNEIQTAGNIDVTVTSPVITGGSELVSVAVLAGDDQEVVAAKIAAALNGNTDITDHYFVGSSLRAVALTSKIPGLAGQEASLNIALAASGGAAPFTAAASSANTQAGSNTPPVNTAGGLANTTYLNGVNVRNLWYDGGGFPQSGNSQPNTNPLLKTYTRTTVPGTGFGTGTFLTAIDPRPQAVSPLLKSNGATLQAGAPEQVTYRGAFGPGSNDNWAAGWTRTWVSGILQGGNTAPIVDVDGDGIDDTLEGTPELTALGFSPSVNNVTNHNNTPGTNLFDSIYTETSILDLRTTAGVTVQKVGNTASLSVPVEKSDTLGGWDDAGNLTLDVDVTASPTKQFYRLEVKGAN